VGTAMFASILAQFYELMTERSAQIVGAASMFHDIGIIQMPAHFKEEDESKLTGEEITLFRTHPAVGAKMLQEVRGIEPTAIQAVAQHHLRLGNLGYPRSI